MTYLRLGSVLGPQTSSTRDLLSAGFGFNCKACNVDMAGRGRAGLGGRHYQMTRRSVTTQGPGLLEPITRRAMEVDLEVAAIHSGREDHH